MLVLKLSGIQKLLNVEKFKFVISWGVLNFITLQRLTWANKKYIMQILESESQNVLDPGLSNP
jgi:hypothetical protein